MRRGVHTLEDIRLRCDKVGKCWIWNGYADRKSRPGANLRGNMVKGQRLTAFIMGRDGERGHGQRWTAKCGNPLCLSPTCLLLTTHRECHLIASRSGRLKRDADAVARIRAARRTSPRKCMPDEIIRWALESPQNSRAVAFAVGVDPSAVRAWRAGKNRRDLSVGAFEQLMRSQQ